MAQSKTAKIMAILALSGIIISVIGTGILFFMGSENDTKKQISKEDLQKLINENKIEISGSGIVK